ncbi:MAG: hypothetical protein KC502_07370 [Myxococcales bacterium]|nr:hypothetical protein [Myxococcales bacterium]
MSPRIELPTNRLALSEAGHPTEVRACWVRKFVYPRGMLAAAVTIAVVILPALLWADVALASASVGLHHPRLNVPLYTMSQWTTGLVALAALSLTIAAHRSRHDGVRRPVLRAHIKLTHALPALIQCGIYAYWALYWRPLPGLLAFIGWQLIWAFSLDCALRLWRYGQWTVGLGPAPIVLSANLIAMFTPTEWPMSVAIITLALLSREFIRIDGRHIFNPSAFGVAAIGVCNLIWPHLGNADRAHEFSVPPNMTEVVVVLALIVQVRLPVVLSTLGAAAALWLLEGMGMPVMSPTWAPVTLVLLLFLTDPATIPKGPTGRLLFGLIAGTLMGVIGVGLESAGNSDFYAKAIPIPLTNLLTPAISRWADAVDHRLPQLADTLNPRHNLRHVGLWVAAIALLVSSGVKSNQVSRHTHRVHRVNRTPCLQLDAGEVDCERNPLFCQPLRFDLEVRCWWRRLHEPDEAG